MGLCEGDEEVGAGASPGIVINVGGVDEEGRLVEEKLGDL